MKEIIDISDKDISDKGLLSKIYEKKPLKIQQ